MKQKAGDKILTGQRSASTEVDLLEIHEDDHREDEYECGNGQ
jgi:hypothetical protein